MRVEEHRDLAVLSKHAEEWDALAERGRNLFLTTAWLNSWWRAFGEQGFLLLLFRDADGRLVAGACLRRGRRRWAGLSSASGEDTNDWDVVAVDDEARRQVWRAVGDLGGSGRLQLNGLRDSPSGAGCAREVLQVRGYRVWEADRRPSPRLELPGSYQDLLAGRSRNLRSQVARRQRALERAGRLDLRVGTTAEDVDRDLPAFLRMEASGWKGQGGTAIVSDARIEQLYRDFARAAADAGYLRLYLLELDGELIAGDLGCVFAGGSWLLKTGYDEKHARLSPGLVLRARALRAAIEEEGCSYYEFLGGAEDYKLRWTSESLPRVALTAYRGPWRAAYRYRATIRPALSAGVRRARAGRDRVRGRGSDAPQSSQSSQSSQPDPSVGNGDRVGGDRPLPPAGEVSGQLPEVGDRRLPGDQQPER